MIKKDDFLGLVINQLTLNDEKNYDDDKILFYTNMALKIISAELDLHIKEIKVELKKNVEYYLPIDLIKILAIKHNNNLIKTIPYEQYAQKTTNDNVIILSSNMMFSNFDLKNAELIYSYYDEVKLDDIYINIPIICEKALYYQTMSIAKEMILNATKNLEQATYFRNLYDIEILRCKNLLSTKHKYFISTYKEV